MTRSPNSGNDIEPSNRRLWLVLLGRTSLVLFVILLAGIAVGALWARNYIYTELAPLVEQNLEQLLGRPIKVGKVERFSLSSLRFSSLSIPATSTDPDQVSAKAVDVQFSLLQVILTRKLGLNVTLVQPNVFIQQDKDGSWVRAEVKSGEGKGTIQTELQSLEIQDGDIELLPAPAPTKPKGSVVLDQVGGVAHFLPDNQGADYQINAQLTRGGAVKISGNTQFKTQNTNIKVLADKLKASDITRLIQLPIALQSGQVDADLEAQILSNKSTEIALNGTAIANKVTAQIQNIPQQFANSTGRLVFQGQTITLDNLSTSFGKVPLLANGTVDTKKGFNLSAQIKSVTAKNLLDTFKVTSPVLAAGEMQANIKVQGSLQQPILSGTASNTKPIQVDRVLFKAVNTDFRLSVSQTASQIAVNNLELVPAAGGEIRGSGQATLGGQVKFNVAADGVSGDILARSYGVTPPINVGNVSARALISGSLGKQPLALNISSVQVKPPAGGQITGNGQLQLASQGKVLFNVKAENLPGDAIAKTNASSSIKLGTVSANARIFGTLGNIQTVAQIQAPAATYPTSGQVAITQQGNNILFPNAVFNVAGSTIRATGRIVDQRWQAAVNAQQVQLNRFKEIPTQFEGVVSNAAVNLSGTTASFQPNNIQASGRANLTVAGGTVNVTNANLNNGRWQAAVNAQQLQLSRFQQVPPQFQGVVNNAALNLSGTTASFQPANIQASGRANLSVAGGTVNVTNANLNAGRWQAVANVSQVQLNRFSPQLRGRLNSNVELAGTTASFQLADIRAAGQIRASQGLGPLAQPLTAQFQWNGNQIIIPRATTPGLSANGAIAVQLPDNGTPRIAGFNLNIVAQNFNLNNTGLQVPGDLALAGFLDFNGRVTGTLETPQASGDIQLRNFNVSNLAFDPVLTGNVNFRGGQGGSLQLAGRQDRIALNLGANYRPTSFLVKRGEAVTTGRTEGDNLIVNAQQFPIALIGGFLPDSRLKPLGGQLSGNLVVNLNNYAIAGDVAIAAPRVGRVSADAFQANINYANGVASLNNGLLRLGDSNIALSGSLQAGNNPQFQVQANFDQTRIERVLQAFKIFDFKDLGGFESPTLAGAEALNTTPVSLPNADLQTQLEYFSKIQTSVAKQQQQERRNAPPLPTLAELSGAISGGITANGSLRTGLNVGFNVQGANWKWGDYSIDEVIAKGNFADGVVTLSPLSIGINQGQVAFSGQLGSELSGQLRVASLPLSLFQPFIERYPIDVTGEVNAVANLQGTLQDPTVGGQLSLFNATLNQQPVQTGQVNFNYNDARLNFDSTLLLQGTQPVTATGSVPVPLPFVAVQPSNQINVNANVKNEGLALLNLFTNNQVSWIDGQGQVNVNVQGTLNKPFINGNATVNNATLRAQALSEPLTNVTGTVLFNGNTVNVQGIQGNYNQGLVAASGILPIFTAEQTISNPLTVTIEKQLDFQVPGLYEGGVSGDAVIRGTALRPQIGGEIELSNGQVIIGKTATSTSNTTTTPNDNNNNLTTAENSINAATTTQTNTINNLTTAENSINATTTTQTNTNPTTRPNLPVEFTDLRLVLGNDVRVTSQPLFDFIPGGAALSQPILSFNAKGDLTINGTLADPLPEGVISLTGGRISLFSTEFTLERGYEQTATFTPSQGLDPTLDVRLLAIVPETSGTSDRILESPLSAEISDVSANTFGTLRTVRVHATATGPASELSNNLELTSEPRRSRGEIVALLGGSIINNFAQTGDATQGLTNFASTTVLGSLQGTITAIGQAIGFSEFRIYPTPNTNRASRASVLNLSAEGVFNINNNLSVSLSRAFSNNEPFNYNLLYRLNDEILVRGSTNLSDDSQLILNYETRF
ncbi:translocation/assembly module TamB domain-containing protein [Nostoc sp. CENA67]|uniref:Translocation/assembly module TamB domain-containing protein n=1 Tax=Amazonocrinis nigriterrae CENA67 TaxID=2794033 RepID=A0A8J7LB67_9NOST|nr:translocation/assembly module TamB [Amazonocrinis nigriterrae]MBH8565465.1 translocation/assembly module TamB domain-containing protein [Amazonocrinis nigriterrae CENA67]